MYGPRWTALCLLPSSPCLYSSADPHVSLWWGISKPESSHHTRHSLSAFWGPQFLWRLTSKGSSQWCQGSAVLRAAAPSLGGDPGEQRLPTLEWWIPCEGIHSCTDWEEGREGLGSGAKPAGRLRHAPSSLQNRGGMHSNMWPSLGAGETSRTMKVAINPKVQPYAKGHCTELS